MQNIRRNILVVKSIFSLCTSEVKSGNVGMLLVYILNYDLLLELPQCGQKHGATFVGLNGHAC